MGGPSVSLLNISGKPRSTPAQQNIIVTNQRNSVNELDFNEPTEVSSFHPV